MEPYCVLFFEKNVRKLVNMETIIFYMSYFFCLFRTIFTLFYGLFLNIYFGVVMAIFFGVVFCCK